MPRGLVIPLRLILFASLLWTTSCATIIHGTTQEIPITSDPAEATVIVAGQPNEYVTPCSIELKRKYDHLLTISKDGFAPSTVALKSELSGAVAGNIIAGGLIGLGVDAMSGGNSRLVPDTVHVKLAPNEPEEKPEAEEPDLVAVLQELQGMREREELDPEDCAALRRHAIAGKLDMENLLGRLAYADNLHELGVINVEERQLMRKRVIAECCETSG